MCHRTHRVTTNHAFCVCRLSLPPFLTAAVHPNQTEHSYQSQSRESCIWRAFCRGAITGFEWLLLGQLSNLKLVVYQYYARAGVTNGQSRWHLIKSR